MFCVDSVKAITDKTNFAFSCQEIIKKLPAATHRLKEIHRRKIPLIFVVAAQRCVCWNASTVVEPIFLQ